MYKSNVLNLLGVFAALALSFLLLSRVAAPVAETAAADIATYETGPGSSPRPPNAIIVESLPADAIIIEAVPAQ